MPVRPYVRGALYTSYAHEWEYKTGQAYVGEKPHTAIYSAIVWMRRRRKLTA